MRLPGAKHATHFAACFAPGSHIDLDQATTEWLDAPSHTIPSGTWHLRSQSPNDTGSRLVVVTKHLPLPQTTAYLVELLLDPSEGQST